MNGIRLALSPQEQRVVELVSEGHPNKTIAGKLGISEFTVSSYLRRIMAKTMSNSRAHMVAVYLHDKYQAEIAALRSKEETIVNHDEAI